MLLRLTIAGWLAVSSMTTAAHADDPAPWARGVTEVQKARATEFLESGNAQFLARDYLVALDLYRQAIGVWDHPAIRFNIVRCLIQLDRIVEALENLEETLRYGEAPLEPAIYQEALAYEKLLAGRVSTLTVECVQPRVAVSLDGQELGTCPLRITRRIDPGKHQLIGTGPGLLTRVQDLVLVGGASQTATLALDAIPAAPAAPGISPRSYGKVALYTGGGLLLVSGALGLYAWSSYHAQFDEHCVDDPDGGSPICDQTGLDAIDRARFVSGTATVVGVAGTVAAVTGVILLLRFPADGERSRRVVPMASATSVGLAVQIGF